MCFKRIESVEDGNPFADRATRRGFIRKVFAILATQMLFTIGLIVASTFIDEVHDYFIDAHYWLYVSMGVMLVVMIGFGCCGQFFRRCPWSAIAIIILTVAMTFSACVIAAQYQKYLVFQAFGTVAGVFTVLLLFALFIPCDLTMCWMLSLALSVVLIIAVIVGLFVPSKPLWITICSLGIAISVIGMIVDLQMIIGGRHIRHQFDEEDYAYAAICLYVDIISMFLYILELLGLTT